MPTPMPGRPTPDEPMPAIADVESIDATRFLLTPDLLGPDGFHPNQKGQDRLAAELEREPVRAARREPQHALAELESRCDGPVGLKVEDLTRAVEEHEERLFATLLDGLAAVPGVTLHGAPKRRTPTALFSVAGRSTGEVYEALAARDVNAPASHFYAIEAVRWMGIGDAGAVRAGLAVYTDDAEVDRLLTALAEIAR